MKCEKCGNDIKIALGTNLINKGCKVLTSITSIVTVQCEKCNHVFQVSINSKSFMNVKEDKL